MTKLHKNMNRRSFITRSLLASQGLALRSMATGLPAAFLLGQPLHAAQQAMDYKYLIMSLNQNGDPINANGPGMYADPNIDPENINDVRRYIQHASALDLPDMNLGTINGVDITADDFANSTQFFMGGQQVRASKIWSLLPQAWLDHMSCLNIATGANAHPEFSAVLGFSGAIKGADGSGSEYLPSLLAQETRSGLATLMAEPVVLGGKTYASEGKTISKLNPNDIKSLFVGGYSYMDDLNRIRDKSIDRIYQQTKISGNKAQMNFIDQYAQSRSQAKQIGESLNDLITDVNGNDPSNQVKMAIALFRLNITPVVTIGLECGSDNHQDDTLIKETVQSVNTMNVLAQLHQGLVDANLDDRVNFANLNTFGRTLVRNSNGGRNHNKNHHSMFIYGSNINPGIIGDLEAVYKKGAVKDIVSMPFNSETGTSVNPDISLDESLAAAGKTLAKSIGIAQGVIDKRIIGGKVINPVIIS
ncbi:MAG: DUF1501 domain-containing protein [Saccharospirillaceae bacterium]|nr:DUF1501 domain-containing protein [Pseudomonadales bacterium]NRB77573.1 DUF1501 domain-containing protein [Saccharospirillaceae bacterium]